jgi:hypothetical protein
VSDRFLCTEPTFVFLTGDLFSAEIQRGPYAGRQLKWALEPLASPDVRAFACLGVRLPNTTALSFAQRLILHSRARTRAFLAQNHDYEGLSLIQTTFKSLGIRLLCDESETVQTGTPAQRACMHCTRAITDAFLL